MSTDSEYHVSSRDWPMGADEGDLTVEQVYGVFDEFDRYYSLAMRELAKTTVPPPEPEPQQS